MIKNTFILIKIQIIKFQEDFFRCRGEGDKNLTPQGFTCEENVMSKGCVNLLYRYRKNHKFQKKNPS